MKDMQTQKDLITAAIDAEIHRPGALLPILHAVQDRIGYVPDAALPQIAQRLNLSRAEVHGVLSFYPHYRTSPPGKHTVQICMAEACQAMGANELARHAQSSLGVELHATTGDGCFTLEPVYCLGNCACSPSVMIDDDLHGRVSAQRLDLLVENLRKEP